MIPKRATFEKELDDTVAIYDVSHLLPKHSEKKYRTRGAACEVYIHHSGRLGRPGFRGLYNSARYSVLRRNWPGCPYHFWIPRTPVYDEFDRPVIFRANHDNVRTYHAGRGPNNRGIAICLQGNTTRAEPTIGQLRCLGSLLAFYREFFDVPVFGHCEAPEDGHSKASCPGSYAMAYLRGVRSVRP